MYSIIPEINIIAGWIPVDLNTANLATGARIKMDDADKLLLVLFKAIGTNGEDPTVTVYQHNAATGGTSKALNFTKVYKKQAASEAALQALSAWTEVTQASGNTYTNTDLAEQPAIIAIEISAGDLDVKNGYYWVNFTASGTLSNAQLCAGFYVKSGRRLHSAAV